MGLVVRKCHFDVTACGEARQLAQRAERSLRDLSALWASRRALRAGWKKHIVHFKKYTDRELQNAQNAPQDLQIISLTSPLLDILDLHPITTHLSKLPIFRDAATKWPHSSTSPEFHLFQISCDETYFLVWLLVAQIFPSKLLTLPCIYKVLVEGQMSESWKFNFVLRHNFPPLSSPTLSCLSLFTFETRFSL